MTQLRIVVHSVGNKNDHINNGINEIIILTFSFSFLLRLASASNPNWSIDEISSLKLSIVSSRAKMISCTLRKSSNSISVTLVNDKK